LSCSLRVALCFIPVFDIAAMLISCSVIIYSTG
jgi:hypothetical protein